MTDGSEGKTIIEFHCHRSALTAVEGFPRSKASINGFAGVSPRNRPPRSPLAFEVGNEADAAEVYDSLLPPSLARRQGIPTRPRAYEHKNRTIHIPHAFRH